MMGGPSQRPLCGLSSMAAAAGAAPTEPHPPSCSALGVGHAHAPPQRLAVTAARGGRRSQHQVLPQRLALLVPTNAVQAEADRVGAADANAKLALHRAESARDRMVEAGLTLQRVEVSSHGENNPAVPTADNVAEPRNRRVEVTIR